MTEGEEADRLINRISETLSRHFGFPRLSSLEREVMFHDFQRELFEAFERIFEAGYQEGRMELEDEDADHLGR
jgi:hypothetical protein